MWGKLGSFIILELNLFLCHDKLKADYIAGTFPGKKLWSNMRFWE